MITVAIYFKKTTKTKTKTKQKPSKMHILYSVIYLKIVSFAKW